MTPTMDNGHRVDLLPGSCVLKLALVDTCVMYHCDVHLAKQIPLRTCVGVWS